MIEKIEDIRNLLSGMKSVREAHEGVWDDIIEQLFPFLYSSWQNKETRGNRYDSKIYDSYPLQMANIASDGIQGHLVSDSFRWFTLSLSKAKNEPVIRKYLQDAEDQMFYEFQRSNFYEEINEYINDSQIIGTSHMYAQEAIEGDRIVFRCIHPKEVYIDEGFDGKVDTHVREFYLTVKKAVEKFGIYDQAIQRMVDQKLWLHEIKFVHVVRPRVMTQYGASPQTRKFESLYIDLDNNIIVHEGGYDVNPFASWRWRKLSHEVYGRGPAYDAYRDIAMLNEIGRTLLGTAQRQADPVMFIPSEMKNDFDLRAGANNYYMDPNRIPFQMAERGNYPVGKDREDSKRQSVRQAFNVDFFLMLQSSEREMTATEIIEKQNEKVAILGPMIGRLQSEGLNPIIDIVFDIANKSGRMPKMPQQLVDMYGGNKIDVDYTGPLAQAQKRLRMQGTQAALQTVLPYAQVDPTIIDRINMDEVAKSIMESYGMRETAIRSDGEVKKIREQRAKQQEAQQQADVQEQQARSNRDNSQAASMATQVMRGQ